MDVSDENALLRYGPLAGTVLLFVTNIVLVAWFASHDDARIGEIERDQISTKLTVQQLNDSREKTDIHLTQVDDRLAEMSGKISTILDIVTRFEQSHYGEGDAPPSSGQKRR